MDVPINLLQWEIFLPEQYKVKDFGGDAIAANLLPAASLDVSGAEGALNGMARGYSFDMLSLLPGQLGGIVVDPTGAMVPNAQVTVTQIDTGAQRTVVTDNSGRWIVSNLSTGRVKIAVNAFGFKQLVSQINYNGRGPVPFNFALSVGAASELVEVTAANGRLSGYSTVDLERLQRYVRKNPEKQQIAASSNVTNLQQRISGVLPVRVDVPRAGNSYNFVRPLVLEEETKVSFTYKSK